MRFFLCDELTVFPSHELTVFFGPAFHLVVRVLGYVLEAWSDPVGHIWTWDFTDLGLSSGSVTTYLH